MSVASHSFPSGLHTVRGARRFVSETLDAWGAGEYAFSAPQVLSELATNAALHARSPFTVVLRREGDCLYVSVSDDSPRPPRPRQYSLEATTGRGMGLVAALSLDWGSTANPGGGKTVWARVAPDGTDGASGEWADLLEEADTSSAGTATTNHKGVTASSAASRAA